MKPPVESSRPEQRIHMRFDKLFPVLIGSEVFGDSMCVARNISAGGMLVEMHEPLPLGSVVTVHFLCTRDDGQTDELVARAEVKHHYCLNFGGAEYGSTRAIGLKFLEFDDRLPLDLPGFRILH
ncbi:MAG TPA: PilZ domain-containing protein [Kofleriaceae bacterium]|nr:PilZ domain-containing protein [Kofleriaceae bacterium]